MPILAYCVSMAHHFLDAPTEGIASAAVYEVEDLGLRAWYSEVEADTFSGADHVTKAALEFHKFVSAVFREGTVLPFRFPTILESVDELRAHLEQKAPWYTNVLRRSEGLAQFEARIINKGKPTTAPDSGKEYLEQRKQIHDRGTKAVTDLLRGLDDYLREHHVKESPQGTRVFLQVERLRVGAFREAAAGIGVPDSIEIRLSGPWPPTEFLPAPEEEP